MVEPCKTRFSFQCLIGPIELLLQGLNQVDMAEGPGNDSIAVL